MTVEEFIGSKACVRVAPSTEQWGSIVSVPQAVEVENIEFAITNSTQIKLSSEDVVTTTGYNIGDIEHAGYKKLSFDRSRTIIPGKHRKALTGEGHGQTARPSCEAMVSKVWGCTGFATISKV
jgi:hypothetical protein